MRVLVLVVMFAVVPALVGCGSQTAGTDPNKGQAVETVKDAKGKEKQLPAGAAPIEPD